jgi:hypothetical protein
MMNQTQREALRHFLTTTAVDVYFKKTNGEDRKMSSTLVPEYIKANKDGEKTHGRKTNPEVAVVWDLERQDWRSFRYDSVYQIKIPNIDLEVNYDTE